MKINENREMGERTVTENDKVQNEEEENNNEISKF